MSSLAAAIGIAKPRPSAFDATAVLMPTTLPAPSRSGPPLLPGLIAASVWIRPSRVVSRPVDWSVTVICAVQAGDDPARHGLRVAAERAADRDRGLADLEGGRVADRRGVEPRRVDLDEREVGVVRDADDARRQLRAIGEGDRQALAVGDDVAVREDVAVRGQHDARTDAARRHRERRQAVRAHPVGRDGHHRFARRGDHLGEVRVGRRLDRPGGALRVAGVGERAGEQRHGAGGREGAGQEADGEQAGEAPTARAGRPGRPVGHRSIEPGRRCRLDVDVGG